MAKFTKIKKWAQENGFEFTDKTEAYTGARVRVRVTADLYFDIEERESTIYTSVRGGQKGNPKGIYLRINHKGQRNYSWQYKSQTEMIQRMEKEVSQ